MRRKSSPGIMAELITQPWYPTFHVALSGTLRYLTVCFVASIPCQSVYGNPSATWNADPQVVQELNSVNDRLVAAYVSEDIKTLRSMLDDAHVHNNVFGVPLTKRQFLQDIESGTLVFDTYETDTIRWFVDGDTAIATGIIHADAKRDGRSVPARRFLFTRVFTKRDNEWKVLLFHNTMMK